MERTSWRESDAHHGRVQDEEVCSCSNTSLAAARSSTASPSDLKTVIFACGIGLGSGKQLAQFGIDWRVRQQHIAGFFHRRLARIHNHRAAHGIVIHFTILRTDRAHRIHQRARLQPRAPKHRLRRVRNGHDDIRSADRVFGRGRLRSDLIGKRLRMLRIAAPDADVDQTFAPPRAHENAPWLALRCPESPGFSRPQPTAVWLRPPTPLRCASR